MSNLNEQEEFEFRHRAEQEAQHAPQPSSKPKWEDAGLLSKINDFNWVTHEPIKKDPARTPIEPSVAENFAYPSGVTSTALIQGFKALTGHPDKAGMAGDMADALSGRAKSAPQQLEELGLHPIASHAVGIPLQGLTDPMAGFTGKPVEAALSPVGEFIKNRLKGLSTAAAKVHLRPTPAVKQALGEEGLDAAANEAMEQGAIRPFTKASTTADNLDAITDKLGFDKGEMLRNSDAVVDPAAIAERAHNEVAAPMLANSEKEAAGAAMGRKLNRFVDKYAPEMPVSQLDEVKQAAQSGVNYMATSPQAVAGQEAQRGWANVLRKGVEEAVPEVAPINQELHSLYNAQAMAGRTGALQNGGGLMGHMTDVAHGVNAARDISDGKILGPAMAIGRAITKGRVSSTVAAGARAAAGMAPGATNLVAKTIANRMALKSKGELQQDLIDQQTNPQAQDELKRSQQ